jgi:hypothetical protein
MALVRGLAAVVLLASVAWGQIGTPPACRGAIKDRERFQAHGRSIKFHLRFHTAAGTYVARTVIKLPPAGPEDPACTKGDVVDFVVDELVTERQQFLPADARHSGGRDLAHRSP